MLQRFIFICVTIFLIQSKAYPDSQPAELYRKMIAFKVVDSFQVRNLTITRGPASITLVSGEIKMIETTQDRYHAALFTGQGTFHFRPPNPLEGDQLHKFTDTRILEESFQSILFRFSDSSAQELLAAKSADAKTSGSESCGKCQEVKNKLLKRYLRNVDSRILRDIYAGKSGYFVAYVFGKSKGEFLLEIDPEQEEEFSITQLSRMDFIDVWSSFSYQPSSHQDEISIPYFEVEVEIEKDGNISATAMIELIPAVDFKTIAVQFSPLMELKEVTDDHGNPCFFIYETGEDRIGEPPLKQDRVDIFLPSPFSKSEKKKSEIRLQF